MTSAEKLRDLVSALTAEQRDLLRRLLADGGGTTAATATRDAAPMAGGQPRHDGGGASTPTRTGRMRAGLFFFSEDTTRGADGYRLLRESARLADELGLSAIWTPERHFHPFGGAYPNPSLLAAALAMTTSRLQLRAGSVVMPLHHPIRVAEEWSVVDNLSNGRAAIACATGWHLADFVLAPETYARRRETTWEHLQTVQRLWRGETVSFPGVEGREAGVTLYPRPIQSQLPVWITVSGNPDTYRKAGELGANVLTHMSTQTIDELNGHIASYRAALVENGHDPAAREVSLMLHTYVGESDRAVKDAVRQPMYEYLRSNLALHARQAQERQAALSASGFSRDDEFALLEHAFERYYQDRALFGSPRTCASMLERLAAAGVTEIACLVDFGLPRERVLEGIRWLSTLFPSTDRQSASSAA